MLTIIGTIHTATGNTLIDSEGMEYPEMAPVPGYHVNTLPEYMSAELEPFVVVPTVPQRVYAGRDDTACLRFDSEEQFKEVTGYGADELAD